jgi:hypothetical protein
MDRRMKPGLVSALSMVLIGLLLLVSGAPCTPPAPLSQAQISSLDPCRQRQAPAPECAQDCCRPFDLPAGAPAFHPAAAIALPFDSLAPVAHGRLVRPPIPPPRSPMI